MTPATRVDKAVLTTVLAMGAASWLAIPVCGTFLPLLGWSGGVLSLGFAAKLREEAIRETKRRQGRRSKRKKR